MNGSKRETLNNFILLIVLFFALNIKLILPQLQGSYWYVPISMLTATGAYILLMRLLYLLVSKSDFLMRLYWGPLYLKGYWSYEYSREGKIYFGVWQFEQDLDSITVLGYGLDENFSSRTIVRSVSPLIEEQGAYFVLNVRNELNSSYRVVTPVYSKTTLILDTKRIFSEVKTIRATTEIYGGSSSGHLHPNVVFRKHIKAKSGEDVINDLRKRFGKNEAQIIQKIAENNSVVEISDKESEKKLSPSSSPPVVNQEPLG